MLLSSHLYSVVYFTQQDSFQGSFGGHRFGDCLGVHPWCCWWPAPTRAHNINANNKENRSNQHIVHRKSILFITNAGCPFAGCGRCFSRQMDSPFKQVSRWWEAPEKSLTCLCFVEYSWRGPIPVCPTSPLYPTAAPLRALCESWAFWDSLTFDPLDPHVPPTLRDWCNMTALVPSLHHNQFMATCSCVWVWLTTIFK